MRMDLLKPTAQLAADRARERAAENRARFEPTAPVSAPKAQMAMRCGGMREPGARMDRPEPVKARPKPQLSEAGYRHAGGLSMSSGDQPVALSRSHAPVTADPDSVARKGSRVSAQPAEISGFATGGGWAK